MLLAILLVGIATFLIVLRMALGLKEAKETIESSPITRIARGLF